MSRRDSDSSLIVRNMQWSGAATGSSHKLTAVKGRDSSASSRVLHVARTCGARAPEASHQP